RDYYDSKGITYIDRDAQTNRAYRAEMFKFSGDDPTVPCIVEDGKFVQTGRVSVKRNFQADTSVIRPGFDSRQEVPMKLFRLLLASLFSILTIAFVNVMAQDGNSSMMLQ